MHHSHVYEINVIINIIEKYVPNIILPYCNYDNIVPVVCIAAVPSTG